MMVINWHRSATAPSGINMCVVHRQISRKKMKKKEQYRYSAELYKYSAQQF